MSRQKQISPTELTALLRTHRCGELRSEHVEQKVVLCGWVHRIRDLGKLLLVDLRDHYGVVQLNMSHLTDGAASRCQREAVIKARGTVSLRPAGAAFDDLATGEVEVMVSEMEVLGECQGADLPFLFDAEVETKEELRLRYRYLELRGTRSQDIFKIRSAAALAAREFLAARDFTEIETPMLYKPTPEGARDYLIPSRLHHGSMYALPQSPQMLKQLLMVSGFDRYYQITKCFRDEDLRADRQPEFTQVDLEACFVTEESIQQLALDFCQNFFQLPNLPMPSLSYQQAMTFFGTDKPDLRFGLPLIRLSEMFSKLELPPVKSLYEQHNASEAVGIYVPRQVLAFSRKDLDELMEGIKQDYPQMLAFYAKRESGGMLASGISKWFTEESKNTLVRTTQQAMDIAGRWVQGSCASFDKSLDSQGVWLFMAHPNHHKINKQADLIRRMLAQKAQLAGATKIALGWVHSFPLFEFDEESGEVTSAHHPFTMPKADRVQDFLALDPQALSCDFFMASQSYDVVCNGFEISSGSIRIHREPIQRKVFSLLGMSDAEIEAKFGFFLKALTHGAPPHGGMAFGFDRMVMLLCGIDQLRDVIAFPKTTSGSCLMSGAPHNVSDEDIRLYGLKHK